MDAATTKQKAYIRDLFVKCGSPKWIFNPLKLWNISKKDADLLINGLRVMKNYEAEDLKEIVWQRIQGKGAVKQASKTIDQLEEEVKYDPSVEDWLDQYYYKDGLLHREWTDNWREDNLRKKEVIVYEM